MAETESDVNPAAEEDDSDIAPLVSDMTLEEIEEDLDYLFLSHVGTTVVLSWMITTAAIFVVLTTSRARTIDALIILAVLFVSFFVVYIAANLAATRLVGKTPDARFKCRYVWIFSLIFNGPQGQLLVKMPHDQIEEMLQRRCELLKGQGVAAYSPVNARSDRKWRLLSQLLLNKLPLGLTRVVQAYFYFWWAVLVVLGVVGIVQVVMFIGNEFM